MVIFPSLTADNVWPAMMIAMTVKPTTETRLRMATIETQYGLFDNEHKRIVYVKCNVAYPKLYLAWIT